MSGSLLTLHQAALASLENAETYIHDARTLVERGSNGHASALLVLAEEEIGKSFLLMLRVGGLVVPERILLTHESKQLLEVAVLNVFDFLLKPLPSEVRGVSHSVDVNSRIEEARRLKVTLQRKVERRIARPGRRFAQTKRKQFDRLRLLQSMKEAGMYVEIRGDGTISSPADFKREEVEGYLEVVESNRRAYRRVFGEVLQPAPSEAFLEEVRAMVRPVLAAFGPDSERLLSWLREAKRQGREPHHRRKADQRGRSP